MEFSLLHVVLVLVVVAALALFLRAALKGSRQLGGFWDRDKQRIEEIKRGGRP